MEVKVIPAIANGGEWLRSTPWPRPEWPPSETEMAPLTRRKTRKGEEDGLGGRTKVVSVLCSVYVALNTVRARVMEV